MRRGHRHVEIKGKKGIWNNKYFIIIFTSIVTAVVGYPLICIHEWSTDNQAKEALKKMFSSNVKRVINTLDEFLTANPQKDVIERNKTSKPTITISGLNITVFEDNISHSQLLPNELSKDIFTFYDNLREINDALSNIRNKDLNLSPNNRKVWINQLFIKSRENINLGVKIINECGDKKRKGRAFTYYDISDGNTSEVRLITGTSTIVWE
ncbi:MAG: hypothetical protein FVQ85_17815 [Planctomycetes bacterium]|nr:hypothetical protein [Planctomycetota bacterium]